MQKMWFIYTMEYFSAIKNEDLLSFAGKWMELESIILSEGLRPKMTYINCRDRNGNESKGKKRSNDRPKMGSSSRGGPKA